MFRNLGSNVLEFLQNLDSIHSFMRKEYPDMIPPSFRCDEQSATDRMILHYYSARKGLHPVVVGVIKEAAKTYYKVQLNVNVVSITEDTVAENTGVRQHVEFDIQAKKIQEKMIEDITPTFLAQTKKNSEKQILQQDVEAVKKKLAQIRSELGENALPLVKARGARGKWKAVAKISILHKGFVPNYPDSLLVNPRMFIEIFPFHLIFDSEMKVHQSGVRIQHMMPTIRNRLAFVTDYFTLRYPNFVDFTYENIKRFVRTPFILEFNKYKLEKEWADKHSIQVKVDTHICITGQMFLLRDNGYFLYVASPIVQSWPDMEKRNIKLADIPMWDVTRDFIMSDLELRVRLDKNIRQSLKGSSVNTGGRDVSSLVSVTDQLNQTQRELNLEKERSFSLYKMFLPRQIVDSVNKGNIPSGELFQDVTVLFCDIVQFLPMVARCSPNAVIEMLNSVYASFDGVTRVHDTYRVESVGDAYMVVSGLPERNYNHAERMANTALGMRIVGQEVRSPLTGENIQVIMDGCNGGIRKLSVILVSNDLPI
ncbi:hypothetical protein CHS0354_007194 [Potamilus streckersoni]|uniref:guanylate cyclase n=1 Tax=Potamilus streckersoni TaxID=2493646 RepID=A0AAE0W7T1_9BIVA|nr:hypothetical protein CHS0354_007194 [Potamilus streckersoni]